MKYFAFIILGLVLLLAICGIVLRANMPTAKLTVKAVWLTGKNFNLTRWQTGREAEAFRQGDVRVGEVTWPIWEVAITNRGSAPANWQAVHARKDGKRVTLDEFFLWNIGTSGFLPPGQWTNIAVPMATTSTSLWTVAIRYDSPMSPLEQRLHSWSKPVPMLRHLLPNTDPSFAYDAWHSTTNVATVH